MKLIEIAKHCKRLEERFRKEHEDKAHEADALSQTATKISQRVAISPPQSGSTWSLWGVWNWTFRRANR